MSLCTLIPNQDKINQYYVGIDIKTKSYDSGWRTVQHIMELLLLEQWNLRRKYYNSKMLDKHKFEVRINDKEYLNYLFQHIYNHNHNTITDEVFEVEEAREKFYGINNEGKCYDVFEEDDYTKCLSLWTEELIDLLFFTLEQTVWYETHYLLNLLNFKFNSYNIYDYLTDKANVYYRENSIFDERLRLMLTEESSHLTTWFYDNKKLIKASDSYYTSHTLLKYNRECLRQVKWKDWTDFSDDQYDPVRFGNMFKANRNLYIPILNMLYNRLNQYVPDIMKFKEYDAEHHLSNMFKAIFALYMAKRDVNIDRQMNDPRYNNNVDKDKAEIVGVDV